MYIIFTYKLILVVWVKNAGAVIKYWCPVNKVLAKKKTKTSAT